MTTTSSFEREVLIGAWGELRRRWPALASFSLGIGLLGVIVFGPLVAFTLRRLVNATGDVAIGNTDLLLWTLSATGMLTLAGAGVVTLVGSFFHQAGLMAIARAPVQERRPQLRAGLAVVLRRIRRILGLSGAAILIALVLLAPLLAVGAALYSGLLRDHDINYYLSRRPAEWRTAFRLLAGAGLLWAPGVVYLLIRWSLSLPLAVFGNLRPGRALAESWRRTGASYWPVARTLGLWAIAVFGLGALIQLLYFSAGGAVLGRLGGSPAALVPVLAIGLVLGAALNTVLGWLQFASYSLVTARMADRLAPGTLSGPGNDGEADALARALEEATPARRIGLRGLLLASLLLLAAAVAAGFWLFVSLPTPHQPIVTAHRAGARFAPENTLAALEQAIAARADFAEIDVQRTADGQVAVIHDSDLMRVGGDPRKISEHNFAELAAVDIGSYLDPQFADQRLATLGDFLDAASGRIRFNIELKYYGRDAELVPEVLRLVHEHGMDDQVVLMSLDLDALRQVQRLAPSAEVGYLSSVSVGELSDLEVDFLAISQARVSRPLLRSARRQGVEVHAWTVNDAVAMLDLLELGIDGLITDDPALTALTVKQYQELSAAERLLLRFRDLWRLGPKAAPTSPEQ